MPLKVVLFDFNGVILDDEPIHAQLIQDLMLAENIRCSVEDCQQFCLGRSDRACLQDLFHLRGRTVSQDYLSKLLIQKATAYRHRLATYNPLPIFPGVFELIATFQSHHVKLGLVSGALRSEIEWVLHQAHLLSAFEILVTADDIATSKPSPEGYRQAIARFNGHYPDLNLVPADCLAIEDSFPGLEAARSAGIPVVGVAHTYPFHMMQRRANWAIDSLADLEVQRLIQVFSGQDESLKSRYSEASGMVPPHE
ncbi:MAG: HAD family phosphatase [Thermosynechococcaceae cyanobacterium]